MAPEPESPSEREARLRIEQIQGERLLRVAPSDVPTPDYEGQTSREIFEVKEITVGESRHLAASMLTHPNRCDSDDLQLRWWVLLDGPSLSSSLSPTPDFREPDPELKARLGRGGFTVSTAEERQRQHRDQVQKHRERNAPRLKSLLQDLEPWLCVLEAHDVRETSSATRAGGLEVAHAAWQIAELTNAAQCYGRPLFQGEQAGIELVIGSGYTRTGDPDTLVDRINLYFSLDESYNMRASLSWRDSTAHAVLVFDSELEPEAASARTIGHEFLPAHPPALPAEAEVLWVVIAHLLWCYRRDTEAWTVHEF